MKRHLMIVTLAGLSVIALAAGAQDVAKTPTPTAAPAAPAAAAAPATPAALVGNVKNGESLAYTCRGCHGVTGFKNAYPNYHVPRIGGQSETYLRNALMEYRKGDRPHPTMRAQATSFSEQQIADIAAYLATIKP